LDVHEVNCSTGEVTQRAFNNEEIAQREVERQQAEEQAQLDLLIPTPEEIEQAEFELKAITLLMEVGLI